MITKRLLLLLLVWPVLLWSQTDLIRWNEDTLVPNTVDASAIEKNPLKVSSINNQASIKPTNWDLTFFMVDQMPYSGVLNTSNYIEFKISPKSTNIIEVNRFNFLYRAQGNTVKFQVRASKDSSFSNYTEIAGETIADTNWSNFDQSIVNAGVIKPNEVLYIRIYIYGNDDNFHFKYVNANKVNSGEGPTITGSYANVKNSKPVASDDTFSTTQNNSNKFDILNNDSFESINSISISSPPAYGTVIINGINDITYTPTLDYTGKDVFKYKLTNAKGTSNEATVTVNVTQDVSKTLVRWEGVSNFSKAPTVYNTGVVSSDFSSKNVSIYNESNYFKIGNWGNSGDALNKGYYIEYDIKAKLGYQLVLEKFNISPWGDQNDIPENYQVYCSKNGLFSGEEIALRKADYSTVGSITTKINTDSWFFPSNFILFPNEKITVRVYAYKPKNIWYSYFKLGAMENGASFEGKVQNVTKCSNTVVWNGAWTATPTINSAVIIDVDYAGGAFNACTVTVNSGKKLIINSKQSVIIGYNLINNGSIQVESDGNLVQLNDSYNSGSNLGNVIVKREATLKRLDYNIWGSPVSGQNLKQFSPGTLNTRFYTYNESDNIFYVIDPTINNFQPGIGYGIRASNNASTTPTTVTQVFNGVPNNGVIKVKIKKSSDDKGFNMIANPYPSNIDFEQLVANNAGKIDKVAYFWTNFNQTPEQQQGGAYPKNGYHNNYAIYNASGGVLPTNATSSDVKSPTEVFKVGQGFIVKASITLPVGETEIVFSNDIRTASNDSHFYNYAARRSAPKSTDRFWLDLETPIGVYSHMLLAYKEGATNDFEWDYDAPAYVNGSDGIYSVLGDKKLLIQGRSFPLVENDAVPLGVSFDMSGVHKISLAKKEGIFENGQAVFLHDKLLGTYTNLQNGSYSFDAQQGADESRFEIVYKSGSSLGTGGVTAQKEWQVYQSDDLIHVVSPDDMSKVTVSDASGKVVYQQKVKGRSLQIEASHFVLGMYYVTLENKKGTFTKKIVKK